MKQQCCRACSRKQLNKVRELELVARLLEQDEEEEIIARQPQEGHIARQPQEGHIARQPEEGHIARQPEELVAREHDSLDTVGDNGEISVPVDRWISVSGVARQRDLHGNQDEDILDTVAMQEITLTKEEILAVARELEVENILASILQEQLEQYEAYLEDPLHLKRTV